MSPRGISRTAAAAVALAATLGPTAESDLAIPEPGDGTSPEPAGDEPPPIETLEVLDAAHYADLRRVTQATHEYLARRHRSAESVRADSARITFESLGITVGLLEMLQSLLPLVAPDAAPYRMIPPAIVGDRDLRAEADVARDLHDALRVPFGGDPYARIRALYEAVELAWGLIANAGGWQPGEDRTEGWLEAAQQWRDQHFLPLARGETPMPLSSTTEPAAPAGV